MRGPRPPGEAILITASSGSAIILGAGPAGLAAGFALSRAGWDIQVFEQAPIVGGLARTEWRGDYGFDIGGHRWFTKNDALNQFLVDLLDDELILVDRVSRIYFDGSFVDYPLRLGNVLAQIGPGTSTRAVGDYLKTQALHRLSSRPVVSMEDAYVAQFGRTLYELFFKRYSEKVWGESCSALSGDWVAQRSRGLSLLRAVRGALHGANGGVESMVHRFMYPRRGYGRISERMAEEIVRARGSIALGWQLVGARKERGRIAEVTVSDGVRERHVSGDVFISSVPMTELAKMLAGRPDDPIIRAADSLNFRDLVTLNLMIDRPRVTSDTWIYVHDPDVSFARIHEPRNWSEALAPPGKTSIVLEYFCNAGDEVWRQSDDKLRESAERDLVERLGFLERGEIVDAFAIHSRDAYPRYDIGYRQAVESIKGFLGSFQNLAIVGRGGTFRYNNTDHAIETGLLAARGALGDRVSIEEVNAAAEYLEERRLSPNGLHVAGA